VYSSIYIVYLSIHLWLYSPCGSRQLFQFPKLYTVGRTPWMVDQPIASPLPTQRTTQTENKRTQTSNASSGIRTHDPIVWEGEDGSCLRHRGHCDRLMLFRVMKSRKTRRVGQEVWIGEMWNAWGIVKSGCLKGDISVGRRIRLKSFLNSQDGR
jgi:hypothetical protein